MSPFQGLFAEIGASYGVLFGLRAVGRSKALSPNAVRKLAHVSTCLLALSFPAALQVDWAAFILCLLILIHLAIIRSYQPAKEQFGVILGGLERESWGDLCLPVSIAALFTLSSGRWELYVVPLLILAFADPAAAFVGGRYGSKRWRTPGAAKSPEGSAAFFSAAFLCAYVSLSLGGSLSRGRSFLAAAALAGASTLIEGVSGRGLDNLFVPLGAWLALRLELGLWR